MLGGGPNAAVGWCETAGGGAAGGGAAGTPGRGPAMGAAFWFIISIVPLNFGAALFMENPHLVQV